MDKKFYESMNNIVESHNESLKILLNLIKSLEKRIDEIDSKRKKKWYQFWV